MLNFAATFVFSVFSSIKFSFFVEVSTYYTYARYDHQPNSKFTVPKKNLPNVYVMAACIEAIVRETVLSLNLSI